MTVEGTRAVWACICIGEHRTWIADYTVRNRRRESLKIIGARYALEGQASSQGWRYVPVTVSLKGMIR